MNIVKHRYSAEIQRTRGLLELAAALYDTSLSYQTERAAEQAMQTESRVGYSLTLALTATREKGISFSFAADGFRELQAVSRGTLSLAWINPSVAATMARTWASASLGALFTVRQRCGQPSQRAIRRRPTPGSRSSKRADRPRTPPPPRA